MATDELCATELREDSVDQAAPHSNYSAVVQLVMKDLEQHTKQVGGLMGLISLTVGIASLALRADPLNSYLSGTLAFALLGFLPVQLGQWLVANERLQRTVKFLKMLPASPRQVVLAKFASGWLFLSGSFFVFCLLPFLGCTYLFGASSFVTMKHLWAVYLIALLSVSFCLTLNFLVEKQAVTAVFFAVVVLLAVSAGWLAQKLQLMNSPVATAILHLGASGLVLGLVGIVLWALLLIGLYKLSVLGYRRIPG